MRSLVLLLGLLAACAVEPGSGPTGGGAAGATADGSAHCATDADCTRGGVCARVSPADTQTSAVCLTPCASDAACPAGGGTVGACLLAALVGADATKPAASGFVCALAVDPDPSVGAFGAAPIDGRCARGLAIGNVCSRACVNDGDCGAPLATCAAAPLPGDAPPKVCTP